MPTSSISDSDCVFRSYAPNQGKCPIEIRAFECRRRQNSRHTSSEDAKKEFLLGRDLAEKLLIQDSIQHYDKAIALDSSFALAELNRATSSPTAREFFEHLNKAVKLSEKASAGERLQILAAEAGANGNVAKQKEYLDQLVAQYPNDERARFPLGGYYFGQQDYSNAIEHYKKATELNPSYSTAFNILGYAYRQNEDYAKL
ncbi:MAG: tetratricopeptide repeat protein [Pyrinomonadaceae bacterium]